MKYRSVLPIQAAKISYVAMSFLICLAGILMIAVPEIFSSSVGWITGIAMIVFGLVRTFGYYAKDLYRLAFQYDWLNGLLIIAMGIAVLCHPQIMMHLLCLCLGILVFADGILKFKTGKESRNFGLRGWWIISGLAVLAGVCGLCMMLFPREGSEALIQFFGVMLVLDGVLNAVTAFLAIKVVRNQHPDVIEGEYTMNESEGQ